MRCSSTSALLSVLSLLTLMATSVDAASRNRSSRNTSSTNTSSGVTKTGSGTLVISSNTGTGAVTVIGGNLTVGTGTLTGGTVLSSVASGSTLLVGPSTSTASATSTATSSAPMTLHNPQFTPGSAASFQPGTRQAPAPTTGQPLAISNQLLLNWNQTSSFPVFDWGTSSTPAVTSTLPEIRDGTTLDLNWFSTGGGMIFTTAPSSNVLSGDTLWSVTKTAGAPSLMIAAVPEPSMSLLCLGGFAVVALRRRRM